MNREEATKRAEQELARGAAKAAAEPVDATKPTGAWQVRTESIAERPVERIIK